MSSADLAVQETFGQDRAHADTDRKERQHQRDHLLVGKQHVLGQDRQPGDYCRAEEPEPRHGKRREQKLRLTRHVLNDVE